MARQFYNAFRPSFETLRSYDPVIGVQSAHLVGVYYLVKMSVGKNGD
jgi:hypothetical protein